jgi:hypothetical protein
VSRHDSRETTKIVFEGKLADVIEVLYDCSNRSPGVSRKLRRLSGDLRFDLDDVDAFDDWMSAKLEDANAVTDSMFDAYYREVQDV